MKKKTFWDYFNIFWMAGTLGAVTNMVILFIILEIMFKTYRYFDGDEYGIQVVSVILSAGITVGIYAVIIERGNKT